MPFDATPEVVKVDHPVVDLLKRAKHIISDPRHWCKDVEHRQVGDWFQHCSVGALSLADRGTNESVLYARRFLDAASGSGLVSIVHFNDDPRTTHAMLMMVWDEAIANAERVLADE